jgi:nitrogen PTS system EIIA component
VIAPARSDLLAKTTSAMNLVSKLLPESNVIVDLDVSSKKRVFEQVGLLFENNHNIARSDIFDSLFAREKLGSTGLGQGIAIPHGRIKSLKEALGAVVRTRQPIPFDAPDAQNVSLIFVLLVPDRATDMHLQILSELAQMFSDKAFREQLLAAPTAAELHRLIVQWQPHATSQHSPAV